MLQNYFTAIFRYISRNKGFTIINGSGLVIGMTACLLILQFVMHEFSYDDFHEKKDRLFRVQLDRYDKGTISTRWASGAAGIGPDFKANLPEVKRYTRMRHNGAVLSVGDVFFKEDAIYFASEDFFTMFSVPLIEGTDSLVLKEPFKIVVSASLAKKYFGNTNPVGKTIKDNGRTEYEVTGVFQDLPVNTHLKIDAVMSFESLKKLWNDEITSWNWDGFFTYVELDEHADVNAVEAKLPALTEKINGELMKRFNAGMTFNFQRITDIHLDSDFIGEFKKNGNRQSAYFLTVVALLIIIIAWINYVNLSTAKSIERAREVGVRKVMGSLRSQLIQQFIFESMLINIVAVAVAIVLVIILTPWFGDITSRQLDYMLFMRVEFWLSIIVLVLVGAILSGLYPAFVLSGYKPVDVLKGRFKNSGQGLLFRKGMVIAQFVASMTLLAGTYTVYRQLTFMQDQKLGIDLDQTLIVNSPSVTDSTYQHKFQVFKERLLQYPEVVSVSASTSIPGASPDWNAGGIRRLSQREDEQNQYRVIMMNGDFISSYGLTVLAGRGFSDEVPNEWKSLMLNESALGLMGFNSPEEALHERVLFWGDTFNIIGVVKNYHQESLKKAYDALLFRYDPSPGGFYSIKFNTSKVRQSLTMFEDQWKSVFPGNPFIHFFLDDHYNKQYQADQQFGRVFGIFSALAIFIGCMGLFGLSSLAAIHRTKEIGVRKVMGASVSGIVAMMNREFLALVGIAIVLSIPVGWWLIDLWLSNFAYRVSISWITFAVPGAIVLLIALLTVSIHTLRAANANPVNSLRHE
jgi:putative ABC transport system permease protein